VDIRFDSKTITADFIKKVHDAGFMFHVWTIDDLAKAKLAFSRGAETVTTNCAKKMLDEFKGE
jgi:glycerophosphoryl diester phosphodiesterase